MCGAVYYVDTTALGSSMFLTIFGQNWIATEKVCSLRFRLLRLFVKAVVDNMAFAASVAFATSDACFATGMARSMSSSLPLLAALLRAIGGTTLHGALGLQRGKNCPTDA